MTDLVDGRGHKYADEMRELLGESIRFQSVSGRERDYVKYLESWAVEKGFETDLWVGDDAQMANYPQGQLRHLPLTDRPTLVIKLKGTGEGKSLIFNGHTDVVAAPEPEKWTVPAWGGEERHGFIYGRGACDIKGSIASALWAMLILRDGEPLPGDVLVELIPGEEDCVGLGTLTSVVRGYKSDGVVILEPTESMPRPASRGGARFDITCLGRSVHGTVKWLGDDAIQTARAVLDRLKSMENEFNERSADTLFDAYPIARPITVDTVKAGQWQGMIADHAYVGGYFELLPLDDLKTWERYFFERLRESFRPEQLRIEFSEEYAGHRTNIDEPICRLARQVIEPVKWSPWSAFNSGCEAGLRAGMLGTPTLIWGPGSLAQAHAADEYVEFYQVERCARLFAEFATRWTRS